MKLIIILLTATALHVSAKGYSQNITLSLKDVTLKTAFYEIRKQAPTFDFFYDESLLKDAKKVSIETKNATLNEVLKQCFKDQPLGFRIENSLISVFKKTDPKNEVVNVSNPPITVRGVITNEANEPLEGVSVKLKNSDKGTLTNQKGEFILADVDDNGILEISHISYETLEIPIRKRPELRTSLKSRVSNLGDVVVATGYQTLKVNQVTGAITSLSEDQLDQRVAPDIISKLEGITNGLVVNKDPLTGKNQLRVRGENTLFGYTEPLIVVDNFPYDGDISEINPNDIESISILKDAAAASIWGVRAGNGVIVISTKRGKANRPLRFEINANTTLTEKPDLFYSPYIKPSDYIDYEIFLFQQGRYDGPLNDPNLPAVSPIVEILNNRASGLITAADSTSRINALRGNDWRKEYLNNLYRKSLNQQYQINLSGGGNKTGYYFSAGYDRNLLSLKGNQEDRITFVNRTTFNPIRGLDIQTEINYNEGTVHANGISNVDNIYPYMKIIDDNRMELNFPRYRQGFEDTIERHGFESWKYFPLQEQRLKDNVTKNYSTRIGTQIKYLLVKGLTAALSYQYYRSISKSKQIIDRNSYLMRGSRNTFAILDVDNNFIGTNFPDGGQLDILDNSIVGHNGRFSVDYNNTWGKHALIGLAGGEFREVRSESNSSRFLGYDRNTGSFSTPNTFEVFNTYPSGSSSLGDGNVLGLSNSGKISRYRSIFSNILYRFQDRYSFSASARFDQANIFGVNANDKGTPLWSVGGKWDLSKEKFYNLKYLPKMALRVTYGYQGNLSPDAVAIVTLKYSNPAQYTGFPTSSINNYPNPELRWEKVGQLNIGFDFGSIHNRISGSLDYFSKRGVDLIGNAPVDVTTGVSSIRGNFSDMKSKGVDFTITGQVFNKKNFKWTSTLFINYASEKVTRYDDPIPNSQYLQAYSFITPKVGYPVYSLFSYKWGGLDPMTGDPRIILGDSLDKSYSQNTQGQIAFDDLHYNGRYNPPVAGSFMNTFNWKGVMLTFNITYKLGHYFRRSSIKYSALEFDWRAGNKDFASRWQKPGDEINTNVPSLIYPNPSQMRDDYYLLSDALVEKADHIRLQFLNLGYQLNNNFCRKIGFQHLSIYFYANNLGILWKANKSGIDPDYPYIDYPPARSYSFGIKAGL